MFFGMHVAVCTNSYASMTGYIVSSSFCWRTILKSSVCYHAIVLFAKRTYHQGLMKISWRFKRVV